MHWMSRISLLAVLAGTALFATTARAGAGPCIVAAKGQYVEAIKACKETMQESKDACLNRDHDCVEVCRDTRYQCVVDTGLAAAVAVCNTQRDTDIHNCVATWAAGTHERDLCIDNAQVAAFMCRDDARDTRTDALLLCRTDFRTCAKACGPADPPVDSAACKKAAVAGLKVCKASAREDFQLNKDVCRGLGHTCVEQCRAQRAACVDLVGLDDAIAACNATRDGAIQTCKNNNPPGTAQDDCIDQVQVIAFQCRDQAREDAQPGLAACASAFQACVHPACEGASPSGAFID
jgi:hypothetical protein